VTCFRRFVNRSGRKQKPGGMLLIRTAYRLVFFYILKMFLDFSLTLEQDFYNFRTLYF